MIVTLLLLLVVGHTRTLESYDGLYPPSYVQSRAAFTHARLYILNNLPSNPETHKHYSFSILAGVTIALVKAFDAQEPVYDPLKVLKETIPKALDGYNEISKNVHSLLAEAVANIKPITSLIDTLCSVPISVYECNLKVEEQGIFDRFLRHRAKLLLQIGIASSLMNKEENIINYVLNQDIVVPYLLDNVNTTDYEVFIAELTRAYNLMRPKNVTLPYF